MQLLLGTSVTAAGAMRKHTQDRLDQLYDAISFTLAPNISQPTTASNLGAGGVPAPLGQHKQTRLVCFFPASLSTILPERFQWLRSQLEEARYQDWIMERHRIQLICDVTNSHPFMIGHWCASVNCTGFFWLWWFGVKGHGEGWLN